MNKVLYEFFTDSARMRISSAYRLVVDKETEKLFRGEAYAINSGESVGRFSVRKEDIGVVDVVGPKDVYILRYRTFANSIDEARAMAANAFFELIIKWAMRFAEVEAIFDTSIGTIELPDIGVIEALLGDKMLI